MSVTCPGCGKVLAETVSGKYRRHKAGLVYCDYGGTVIPCQSSSEEEVTVEQGQDATSVPPSAGDAKGSATYATASTASSPPPPELAESASTSAGASLPGVDEYARQLAASSEAVREAFLNSLPKTPFSQPAPVEFEEPTLFSQPAGRKSEAPAEPMSDLGAELTARLKEMFYAYDNRRSSDNRSAQATMGPSEMGTPCDRRLALSIMRMPPVNPGGDGWAAFVGTCIHAGLEAMFMWADAGTGRFAVEQRLEFNSRLVPKGTADLIDRTLFMLDDHKCQGRWSRNKLKSQGPSKTYRVQAHVYAKGARLRGERIDHVAIISWPRDEATLDDLYVWTEEYRPDIADAAFRRVESIGAEVEIRQAQIREEYPDAPDLEIKARVGMEYDVADDCRFCPMFLPNSHNPLNGCNGKR